jgi:hypothetical protein
VSCVAQHIREKKYKPKATIYLTDGYVGSSYEVAQGNVLWGIVGNKAFRPLFNYISGANRSKGKIAMTAPVAQQREGEKIAMTAPVGQRRVQESWAVSFMMPASYTLATLPRPNDASVTLREVPGGRHAVLVFSGFTGEDKVRANTAELLAWMGTKGFKPAGPPQLARYDPPWQLPFMRRNEIVVPVAR